MPEPTAFDLEGHTCCVCTWPLEEAQGDRPMACDQLPECLAAGRWKHDCCDHGPCPVPCRCGANVAKQPMPHHPDCDLGADMAD